jgi:serine/threonine-protein kinase
VDARPTTYRRTVVRWKAAAFAYRRGAPHVPPVTATPDPLFLAFQSAVAGRYSLDRELGRGGMGVVYLANEVDLDRPVAIKLLPPDRAANARLRARFLQEARTAAKLSHPNIIPIHAVDEIGGFVFFAMAYVDGETLAERVRDRGPLPPSEAARVLREVAWALAHAHAHGVVHRDVKPDNILLERGTGRALVADFGIAAAEEGAAGEVTGTPEFMSPEQALGKAVDARSDIYAFGAMAYFALSGRLPFHGRTPTEVLAKQVNVPPPPLAEAAGGLPRKLAQTVERCLAKRPEHRPQTAEILGEQLGVALEQRRELPVALRAFVKHGSRLDGPGMLVFPLVLGLTGGVVASATQSVVAAVAALAGGITLVPLGVLVHRARRLLKMGFGHADLGPAFDVEIERGREEREVDSGVGPSFAERAMRVVSVLGWGAFAVGLVFGWPVLSRPLVAAVMGFGLVAGTGGFLGSLIFLQQRRDVDAEAYGRFWTGTFGRVLFRLARLLTPRRMLAASSTHRPTELSIGMAAEQLWESLPKETRQELPDLPDVIHRLEADAQRLRKRYEELAEAVARATGGGEGRDPDDEAVTSTDRMAEAEHEALSAVRAERDGVRGRMQRTVAALESIRLNLLRLHAGSGTVESITTDLGLAFEAAKEVENLLEAGREVDAALHEPPED